MCIKSGLDSAKMHSSITLSSRKSNLINLICSLLDRNKYASLLVSSVFKNLIGNGHNAGF